MLAASVTTCPDLSGTQVVLYGQSLFKSFRYEMFKCQYIQATTKKSDEGNSEIFPSQLF